MSADDPPRSAVVAVARDSAQTVDQLHKGIGKYLPAGFGYDWGTHKDAPILAGFRQQALAPHPAVGISGAQRIQAGAGRTGISFS